MRDTVFGLGDNEYLRLDGENAMKGPLTLNGDPVQSGEAASKGYMDTRDAASVATAEATAQLLIAAQEIITLATAEATATALVAAEAVLRAAADALLLPLDGSRDMRSDLPLSSFTLMTNTSGGDLVRGDVVVLKAAAAGNEITTTVNQGDDMVFGMLDEDIVDTAAGYVQTEGKTTVLKVNGTVAIAIGDPLGTLNAVQIAMKAAAGDMAFAIALEAYAGADSLGVIDALLIKPRKI